MASQSFNLIGQKEEQELVAFETRQSRGPSPLFRPNSRMEEMMSQLIKSQDATAKSLEARMSALAQIHTSTDGKLSNIAYKQIEQIAEMSDSQSKASSASLLPLIPITTTFLPSNSSPHLPQLKSAV